MKESHFPVIPPLWKPDRFACLSNLAFGLYLSFVLYGIVGLQVLSHLRREGKSGYLLKPILLVVWAFNSLHQVFIVHAAYCLIVINRESGGSLLFEATIWSLSAINLTVMVMFILVNGLFAWRIWQRSKNLPLITLIVFLLLAGAGLSTVWTLKAFHLTIYELLEIRTLTRTIAATNATVDFLIAISWTYYLRERRGVFEILRTALNDSVIATGFSSFLLTLFVLLYDIINPHTFYFVNFYFVLGKWHCASLVATLNYQHHTRTAEITTDEKISTSVSSASPHQSQCFMIGATVTEKTPLL